MYKIHEETFFTKEDIQMATKHTRRCSLLAVREMQTKASARYLCTPVSMAKMKKETNNSDNTECW